VPETVDPSRTALLVMDYQNGILESLADTEALLSRASGAIAVVRRAGGTVGYVRVAFEDSDFAATPSHSRFAQTVTPRCTMSCYRRCFPGKRRC
jgi:nicotinamidase-related amidase